MPRYFLGASIAALIAASPLTAFAQQAAPNSIDPLVVIASRSGDATPADLIGASVTVIGDEAMQDRQTRVVSDILRDVPGVAVSRSGAVGAFTQVRIRGAEANHSLVFIDGIKASDPFFDEFDFGTLIADQDARIEVLRGQQSSLYGSDAIGGVISYTTLTGAEAPGVRLRAEAGSMGTYDGAVRAAGVNGALDYALSVAGLHTDGYPVAPGGHRDVGSDTADASAKLIWTAAPNLHITAVGRYGYTDADLDDTDNDSFSPTFGQTLDSPGVHYVNRAYYGLLRAQLDSLDGRWTNALTVQGADTTRSGYDVANPFAPPAGQPIVKSSGDHGARLRGSFVSAFRFGDEHIKQRLTFVLDAERDSSQTTISPFGAFLGKETTDNVGVVGAYDLTFDDRISFGASLRHDVNNRFADPTTYRIQGSYRFDQGTRLHAAAGSGVKDPSFSELFDFSAGRFIGNPDLKPETSQGWEFGIDQTFLSGHANVGATYFDNRLTDQISTDFSTGVARPINLAGTDRQQGVELFADAQLNADWRVDASYTWLDAPQQRLVILNGAFVTFDGQAVRRAKDIASLNVTWAPVGRPFSGTLTVRYNGKQNDLAFTDPSFVPVLSSLPAFTLVNLNAAWRLNGQVDLFGRVENLLDQDYQEVFSFQAAGRAAFGGLRLRF